MTANSWKTRANRLLREPVFHFFVAGAVLFVAHRLFVGAPLTITVTHGVRAGLSRRFEDANGRPPDATELAAEIHAWEIEEALSREGLREHLDRDDPGIRSILADKMRLRAAFELPQREPTDAELDAWLASHRNLYERPARYDFELVTFPKAEPRAREQLDDFERALQSGKAPASLGRPVIGGNLTAQDLNERVEPEVAEGIPKLAPGAAWKRLETRQSFVMVRLKGVEGALPTREELGVRLVDDWRRITRQQAVDRLLQRTIDRYHFEVDP
ncbi:MAG TPA: peptidylprolyl isomerase [Polyangia bacterium]|jgi:hypothetical protein